MPVQHFIHVTHGKLSLNVPRDLFVGPEAEFDEEREAAFRRTLASRYPWLSSNAIDVIMENSRRVMLDTLEAERSALDKARMAASRGEPQRAVGILRGYLEGAPSDVDGWYLLGETLCRMGDQREGYRAFAEARRLM